VSENGSGYTADADANIDADTATQYWALPVPRVSGELVEGREGCDVSNLVAHQFGPCDPVFGQSVF
jgi:hypothetical protein